MSSEKESGRGKKRARNENQMSPSNSEGTPSSSSGGTRRRSPRLLGRSRSYTDFGEDFPRFGHTRRLLVRPFEFICLFKTREDCFPTYVKRGTTGAPILRYTESFPINFLHPLLNEEQNKRLECLTTCVETFLKDLQLSSDQLTWVDSTSCWDDRYMNCLAVEKSHGFAEVDFTALLDDIYRGLKQGFCNGIARKAMENLFILTKVLLCKRSRVGVFNFGDHHRNEANSHYVEIVHSIGDFAGEEEDTTMLRELMDVKEIEDGIQHSSTPDVALYNTRQGGKRDWFLFGECKFRVKEKDKIRAQVFKQCLNRLIDSDFSYGCGLTTHYIYLSKTVIHAGTNIVRSFEKFFDLREFRGTSTDDFSNDVFNCNGLLDFIMSLAKIIEDSCPNDELN